MEGNNQEKREVCLPIGSVVLLKNGKKRVMVYGRKIRAEGEEKYMTI